MRRRELGRRARLVSLLAPAGVELVVVSVIVAGAVAYLVGRGGI